MHEFSTIPGVREDVIQVDVAIETLRFKTTQCRDSAATTLKLKVKAQLPLLISNARPRLKSLTLISTSLA